MLGNTKFVAVAALTVGAFFASISGPAHAPEAVAAPVAPATIVYSGTSGSTL